MQAFREPNIYSKNQKVSKGRGISETDYEKSDRNVQIKLMTEFTYLVFSNHLYRISLETTKKVAVYPQQDFLLRT